MRNITDDGIVPRFVDANNIVKVYMKSHLGFHDKLLLSRDLLSNLNSDMCSAGLGIIASLGPSQGLKIRGACSTGWG